MAITVTRRYDYNLGPIEEVAVEVLNDRYGRVTARRWHNTREYAIELATLQPEPQLSTHIAWKWLAAAIASFLILATFVAYLMYSNGELSLLVKGGIPALLVILSGIFIYLFIKLSKRQVVFQSRFSGTPLVEIPIPLRDRQRGKAFADELSQLAQKNRARLHHTDEDMRAGELRMLRRLSEEGIIASATYDKAKRLLLNLAK